jgi:DNA-binding PucR family transcriptional regulator
MTDDAAPSTYDLVRRIALRLMEDAASLGADLERAALEANPAIAADPVLAVEARASTRAHMLRWLTSMARHPEKPVPGDLPPEALDIARSLVRRGLDPDQLLNAYRRGQNVALTRWLEHAAADIHDSTQLADVLRVASASIFAYIDTVLDRLFTQIQHERDELLSGGLARRTEIVRLILDGAPVELDHASRRLGYDLSQRHTAIILGHAAGGQVLTLPASTSTLWAWLGTHRDLAPEVLLTAMDGTEPNVCVAVGPLHSGIMGFRRSHAAALDTHRLLIGRAHAPRFTTFREVEAVALVAPDDERVRDFVTSVLGRLATPDEATARLRDTARVYLDEADNAPRTAARMNLHRNTILQRVARAETLLGYPLRERRLAVTLALELVHRLGPHALTDSR